MEKYNAIYNLLNNDENISINKDLIFALGLNEATIFCELLSRYVTSIKNKQLMPGDYFEVTVNDLYLATGLGEKGQRKAIRNLVDKGLISIELKGAPPKRYFKISHKNKIKSAIWYGKEIKHKIINRLIEERLIPMENFRLQNKIAKERDGYRCQLCGINEKDAQTLYGEKLHAHHIIPRVEGGSNNAQNLITLCKKCHMQIHRYIKWHRTAKKEANIKGGDAQ